MTDKVIHFDPVSGEFALCGKHDRQSQGRLLYEYGCDQGREIPRLMHRNRDIRMLLHPHLNTDTVDSRTS